MSARARVAGLLAVSAACGSLLLVLCGSALASVKYLSSFGSFSNVQGVAVDSGTGDVYVYDAGAGSIYKFDAQGSQASFSGTGSNVISGVGTPVYPGESELAVDNSSGPAKGDIYLAPGGAANVEIYSPAGSKLGELSQSAGAPWGEACGVAVDSTGAVYVGIWPEDVNKYVPTANPVSDADYTSSIGGAREPCNLAVDSAGNVFAETWNEGPITRYEPGQFGSLSASGSVVDGRASTLAVDPATDDVYVDEYSQIAQFGPHGEPFEAPLATYGSSGTGALAGSYGVAVSGFNHYIYTSDGQGHISVFGEVTAPQAITGEARSIQATGATLNGAVNPNGYALTACTFEYGTTTSYGQSAPCVESVGAERTPVAVHADVTGLTPGATYHFRLVASNVNGSGEGADEEFATPAPPEVSSATVSHITDTEARVSAEVNPQRLATTYRVEYGTDESYGIHTRKFELGPQDASSHLVTVELAGLSPNTSYRARLVATNALGTVAGEGVSFTTYQHIDTSCPNQATRTGLSARLPDCRAYEQVSVKEKEGASTSEALYNEAYAGLFREHGLLFKAARDGGSMYYVTSNAVAGSPAGGQAGYQADRSASGWITSPLSPPNLLETTPEGGEDYIRTAEYNYLSEDLSCKVLQSAEPLTSDTPATDISQEVKNLYRRNADGTYTLLSNIVPFPPHPGGNYQVLGASPDCKKVVFITSYRFVPNASGALIYEWDEGTLRPVGVLPGGEPPLEGDDPDLYFATSDSELGLVSEDGSRVFFSANNSLGQLKLFMREGNGTASAKTVEIDASQTSTPTGEGFFQAASKSGELVFFLGNPGLAPGNPPAPAKCDHNSGLLCDLYEYDSQSGELMDLSVDSNPADTNANVDGVIAISNDGSHVYFAAKGQITPASGDPSENTQAQNESQNEANVYLSIDGALSFVGRIDDDPRSALSQNSAGESPYNDLADWRDNWAARVTPDGRTLLFMATPKLTGYDNTDAALGTPDPEAYLYMADTGKTVCVSCNPSGARPIYETEGNAGIRVTPIIPISNNWPNQEALNNQPRALSEDGRRVFFETSDQLSPLAKSKESNVYEWEMAGAGTCTSSSRDYSEASDGCVYLLDSGLPESEVTVPAKFVDASANGDDVFLRTPSKLLPEDEDGLADIYDVRVDGGFPGQQSAVPCEGEACQGLAAGVPTFATPSTASLAGSGNVNESQVRSQPRGLSRAQKLARALKACNRKKGKHKKTACRRRARKRYGAVKVRKSARRTGGKR